MKLKQILCVGLLGMTALANASAAAKPNVILIVADDLGTGDVSCYGDGKIATPYLEELASQGLRLTEFRDCCAPFAESDEMELMYHDIGVVRENKAEIRHRVFVTQLKPGMKDEYKRRHDVLVAARGDQVNAGPESNFTIWHAHGYIFG